jgi:RNA polymerase sigma-70 factor (ECF subfamily)
MTDIEIIESIRSGDKSGYDKLFKAHYRKVYNFIGQRIYSREDVEDLSMITFEKAFLKLDTWKPTHKFSSWLCQIAKYTVIDFINAYNIRVHGGDELENHRYIKDDSYTPYQVLLQKELTNLIEGHIDRLPKKSKPVMKLHVIGYTDEEIAEKLSMIHGNVRCILTRAKQKLKPLKELLYNEDNILHCSVA